MQYSADEIKERYGIEHIWTRITSMANVELYSDNENDPIIQAKLDSEFLAKDKNGRELPYVVGLSFFGIPTTEGMQLEDLGHRNRVRGQLIQTQVLVFKDFESYINYVDSGLNIVFTK